MTRTRIHMRPSEALAAGLKSRKQLKAEGLMPTPDAQRAGTVWQGWGAYDVYDQRSCVPWRWAPSDAQLRRQALAARARTLLQSGAVVIDLETTGLASDDEVCEISIVGSNGATLLDTLVRPIKPISEGARALHQISDAMLADAPTWTDVAPRYAAIVAGKTVVTYNTSFDRRMLAQTHKAHGLETPVITAECAMLLYASWAGDWDRHRDCWRWLKLAEAAAECGVLQSGAHRALPDARMALGILQYIQRYQSGRPPSRRKRNHSDAHYKGQPS